MARRNDFRPDPDGSGDLGKLLLTKQQQRSLLRWSLYASVCLLGLLVQDVVLCRLTWYGAVTDIVPCLILMVCTMQGAESGSIFSLVAACLYYFSGSAPGPYVIALLTFPGVLLAILRQSYLRYSFGSVMLSAAVAVLVYEMGLFFVGLSLGHTTGQAVTHFLLTGVYGIVAIPVLYPVFTGICKIGGETWKE